MPKDKKESKKKFKETKESEEKEEVESKKSKNKEDDKNKSDEDDDKKSVKSDKSEHEPDDDQKIPQKHFSHGYAKCLDYDEDEFEREHEDMTIKDMDLEDILKYARCIGRKKKNITVVDGCEITIKKMNGEFRHRVNRPMRHNPLSLGNTSKPFNRPTFQPRPPFQQQPFQQQSFQQQSFQPMNSMNPMGMGGGKPFYQRKLYNQRQAPQQEPAIEGMELN